jgi:hypothetical protein
MAKPFPACLPPLITFNAGTGRINRPLDGVWVNPLRYLYKGWLVCEAPALAKANETANIALAPNLDLHQPN